MEPVISLQDYLQEDLSGLSKEELLQRLEDVRLRIAQLDTTEPEDMMSEAYEEWGELHEDLEDLEDELLDLLDLQS